MSLTKKPCPGCGKVYNRRPANEVCYDCKRLMEDGGRFRAIVTSDDRETRGVPQADHWLPYIPNCGEPERRDFQGAFKKLALLLSMEAGSFCGGRNDVVQGQDGSGKMRSFATGVPALLEQLYLLTIRIAVQAHLNGREEGQDFIADLAAGEVSIDRFDESVRRIGELRKEMEKRPIKRRRA